MSSANERQSSMWAQSRWQTGRRIHWWGSHFDWTRHENDVTYLSYKKKTRHQGGVQWRPRFVIVSLADAKARRPRLVLELVTSKEDWALWTRVRLSVWTFNGDRQDDDSHVCLHMLSAIWMKKLCDLASLYISLNNDLLMKTSLITSPCYSYTLLKQNSV